MLTAHATAIAHVDAALDRCLAAKRTIEDIGTVGTRGIAAGLDEEASRLTHWRDRMMTLQRMDRRTGVRTFRRAVLPGIPALGMAVRLPQRSTGTIDIDPADVRDMHAVRHADDGSGTLSMLIGTPEDSRLVHVDTDDIAETWRWYRQHRAAEVSP